MVVHSFVDALEAILVKARRTVMTHKKVTQDMKRNLTLALAADVAGLVRKSSFPIQPPQVKIYFSDKVDLTIELVWRTADKNWIESNYSREDRGKFIPKHYNPGKQSRGG